MLGYFAATILFGALAAPPLFWAAQRLAGHGILPGLAQFDFEAFFHRAIMLGALIFIWPLLRWLGIRSARDLGLQPNPHWLRDTGMGFLISTGPLLCCALVLLGIGVYGVRASISWDALGSVALSAAVVPFIEEALFRGLFLGVLLRGNRPLAATLLSAGIFSIVHFLKGPDQATAMVSWNSGFISLAHSFDQFVEPMLLLAGFTTLFLLGWILAEARLRTRSLWLPIGLHAGWIFASGALNKIAQREMLALPWLGKSLYVGIVPLGVGLLSWAVMKGWLKSVEPRKR